MSLSSIIRSAVPEDATRICEIYNPYVLGSVVTFEEEAVSDADMAGRIKDVTERLPWLVYEVDGEIVGYAYATKWRVRAAYRYSVESTVYVKQTHIGRGIGKKLYMELLGRLKDLGMHTVMAGISMPNENSVALHEKLGFKKVAEFSEAGFKHGKWINTGYWQLML